MDRFQLLVEWMNANSIHLSPSIRLETVPGAGTGVFANRQIKSDEVLLSVPKSQVLSPSTSGIANLLEDHELEGMIALTVAYMFELGLGKASPWYEFIQSFQAEGSDPSLPRFWDDHERQTLVGTELEEMGGLDETEVREVYDEVISPFFESNGHLFDQKLQTYGAYAKSLRLVSSRAFEVDAFRGLSLVPGACLFNHSDRENVNFESNYSVCEKCGAHEFCEHDVEGMEDEARELAGGSPETADQAANQYDEFAPELMEDPESSEEWDDVEENEDDDRENDDEDDDSVTGSESEDVVEIRAIRPISRGQQVFNTYGEYANGVLLSRYGFAIWDNSAETVSLAAEVAKYCVEADLVNRLKWWKKHFFQVLPNPGPEIDPEEILAMGWREYADIDASGAPSNGLIALITTLLLPANKFMLLQAKASKGLSVSKKHPKLTAGGINLFHYLVQARLSRGKDGGMSSKDYKKVLKSLSIESNPRQRLVAIVRGTEKLVLERALSNSIARVT